MAQRCRPAAASPVGGECRHPTALVRPPDEPRRNTERRLYPIRIGQPNAASRISAIADIESPAFEPVPLRLIRNESERREPHVSKAHVGPHLSLGACLRDLTMRKHAGIGSRGCHGEKRIRRSARQVSPGSHDPHFVARIASMAEGSAAFHGRPRRRGSSRAELPPPLCCRSMPTARGFSCSISRCTSRVRVWD